MATLYILSKYLLLIPIVIIANYLADNAPVSSMEIGSTIGLSYGTWISLFAVALACLLAFFLMCAKDPTSLTGGIDDHKTLE